MNDNEFNERIKELIKEIANLPQDQQKQLGPLVSETEQRHQDIKENSDKVTQSLDNLRICMKYLLFDIEATRREQNEIKRMLDDSLSRNDKHNRAEGEM